SLKIRSKPYPRTGLIDAVSVSHPPYPVYWFVMQIGMIIGFATAFPMNWVLIKTGVKEPCI
ncbi:DUF4396 domain-containing protein, partial [Acidocella aminolytica]|uniref:DUF4396 domain-containing protein n=1 Tax=Acidocella aminolytica TaxID=33998 RepID=UPI00222EC053